MKKNIFKVFALVLCALAVFVGGQKDKVEAKSVNSYEVVISGPAKDKKVVSIEPEPISEVDGKVYKGYYLRGRNQAGEIVWQVNLLIGDSWNYSGHFWVGPHAEGKNNKDLKNYYLLHDNKLFAFDYQTGKFQWKVTARLAGRSNVFEVDDKVVIVDGENSIYLLDMKTGKLINSVKDTMNRYVSKSNNEVEINGKSFFNLNGLLYLEVDNIVEEPRFVFSTKNMIGFLIVDTKKCKIEFVSDVRDDNFIWN